MKTSEITGTIFDIKRFAIHDGPGLRTTVFFKGCPLKCAWCHNPESINPNIESYIQSNNLDGERFKKEKKIGYHITVSDLMFQIKKDNIFFEEGNGGVTLSCGEPLMQADFARDLLKSCGNEGIHTVIDTSGAVPYEMLEKVLPYTDLFLYDIKITDRQKHKKFTGFENDQIFDNFIRLIHSRSKVIARVPVIPGINTTVSEQKEFLDFFVKNRSSVFNEIHLLPYHFIGRSKYLRFGKESGLGKTQAPSRQELNKLSRPLKEKGFIVKVHS